MTAELTIYFDTAEEFLRLLKLLKESDLSNISLKPVIRQEDKPLQGKRDWTGAGSVDFGGALDDVNIRDLAYDEFWEKTKEQYPGMPR